LDKKFILQNKNGNSLSQTIKRNEKTRSIHIQMNENFAKLNLLKSSSIEDVKHYSTTNTSTVGLPVGEITQFLYYSPGDIQYAHTWEYEQFDYMINHLGFRNTEIPKETDIAVFGCSFTFGLGLPIEMIWHTILADRLNTKVANYGVPGASIKTITDLAMIISNHTKINKAIFLLPTYSRMQVAKTSPFEDEVNYLSIIPNHKSELCKKYEIEAELLVKSTPDEEMFKVLRDSVYLVDHIFKERNIKTYFSSWDPDTYEFLTYMDLQGVLLPDWTSKGMQQATTDLARDKLHPGPVHQQQFVDKIIDYIK
jgi:hypothetical protein